MVVSVDIKIVFWIDLLSIKKKNNNDTSNNLKLSILY